MQQVHDRSFPKIGEPMGGIVNWNIAILSSWKHLLKKLLQQLGCSCSQILHTCVSLCVFIPWFELHFLSSYWRSTLPFSSFNPLNICPTFVYHYLISPIYCSYQWSSRFVRNNSYYATAHGKASSTWCVKGMFYSFQL